ncbi:MAG TPA: hypothetical protein DHN29_20200 [Cytophagales bacterium]|nr:hypothetical protein [Cytophagales bacterium]
MKKQFMSAYRYGWLMAAALFVAVFTTSCTEDEPEPEEVIASFQYVISEENYLQVTFTDFSQGADTYEWDFGDGNTSTDQNPVHVYAEAGTFTVKLIASGDGGTAERSEEITITDPFAALRILAGDDSKTWKLYREGTCMSLGASAEAPAGYWAGLTNDGSRPCMYEQTFTFSLDGTYTFDDMGGFWAEYGLFNNVEGCDQSVTAEQCMDVTSGALVNACGDDVSAWLGASHTYTYSTSTNEITIEGEGAWIGIPKLTTDGYTTTPVNSVTFSATIEQLEGYDLLHVVFDYGDNYWPITYASYSDASLEPAIVTEQEEFGSDLDNVAFEKLSHTFAAEDSYVELGTIAGGSLITVGADDPADAAAAKVGEFKRVATDYQEAQMRVSPDPKDILFDNISTITLEVYVPSSNDFTGSLTKNFVVGFADVSATEQWWTDIYQWEQEVTDLDTWVTLTFDVTTPAWVALQDGSTPKDRTDLDMFYIGFGGGGHSTEATVYVRNLVIE